MSDVLVKLEDRIFNCRAADKIVGHQCMCMSGLSALGLQISGRILFKDCCGNIPFPIDDGIGRDNFSQ